MTWQQAVGLLFLWVMIVDFIDGFRIPMPSDWVILEPIRKWAIKGHERDCDLFRDHSWINNPCSCQRSGGKLRVLRRLRNLIALRLQQRACDERRH